jgi:hypothetical protein
MSSATDAHLATSVTSSASADTDSDDVCRFEEDGVRCAASLDDGEGYDGYCGPHADRLEEAGHWS